MMLLVEVCSVSRSAGSRRNQSNLVRTSMKSKTFKYNRFSSTIQTEQGSIPLPRQFIHSWVMPVRNLLQTPLDRSKESFQWDSASRHAIRRAIRRWAGWQDGHRTRAPCPPLGCHHVDYRRCVCSIVEGIRFSCCGD